MIHYLTITPRDPLVARDGRPFGAGQGNRMRSLDWIYPSVLAGSLRTLLGKQIDPEFGSDTVAALKAMSVAGPLPVVDRTLFFPRPLDCVVREEHSVSVRFAVRPAEVPAGEGCDLPLGLRPVLLPDSINGFKPAKAPAFWSDARMTDWLADTQGDGFSLTPLATRAADGFLEAPPKDERIHLKMDPRTGTGEEGNLFTTTGLDLTMKHSSTPIQLSARLDARSEYNEMLASPLDVLHPLGGERRLARWASTSRVATLWACPHRIREALDECPRIRMLVASPAVFSGGWKPGWLERGKHGLEGSPPGSSVTLRLVGAVVDRWQPISGWSLEQPRGPKPVRRLVPAGSVYFFELAGGRAATLADRWLQSVCDGDQDQRDGFGLALWGVWDAHPTATKGT